MRHLVLPVCLIAVMVSAKVASAQVTDAIQKLLPATVAVELKTVHDVPIPDQSKKPEQTQPTTDQPLSSDLTSLSLLAAGAYEQTVTAVDYPVDAVSYASGTVVSPDGLIVTMIGEIGKGNLTVTLADGKQTKAKLLVDDQRSGLQLIKVDDVEDLTPVQVVVSDDVLLGQEVATVVSTDVQDRAAATGIVSAKNRSVTGIGVPLIQTDVSIGPMSAGAPVGNMKGELMGIWIGKKDDAAGISFAVPAKFVRQLVKARGEQDHTVLKRGYLGIRLNDEAEKVERPRITQVMVDSAALETGLMAGDEILKINGEKMVKPKDVVSAIGQLAEGQLVDVLIEREGERMEFEPRLRGFPAANKEARKSYAEAAKAWEHAQLYGVGEDGAVRVWRLEEGDVIRFPKDAPVDPDVLNLWFQQYRNNTKDPKSVAPTTVRVQRADVQKKLDELTQRVISLQSEVEKLTGELKSIGTKLEEE